MKRPFIKKITLLINKVENNEKLGVIFLKWVIEKYIMGCSKYDEKS